MVGRLVSYDPATGEPLGEVQATPPEEVADVVRRGHAAAGEWRRVEAAERVAVLEKAYERVGSCKDELAVLLSREMGKDIRRSTGEVKWVFRGGPRMAQSAREALRPRDIGHGARIEYQPLGVVAVISPWNYPLAMANNFIAPALAAGNSVVLKASEETPLIARAFVDMMNEVLPHNLLQIIHGDGEQGRALVESDVNMIAFTGSREAGRDIMARAAGRLKRLVMELGGNDPMIVMHDADIEQAARFAVANSFENAGQMCVATERIYVDGKIAERFEKRVVELAACCKVGPWDMPDVDIGPIINAGQHGTIVEHIRDAEAKGARMLLGGSRQPERYIHPTVICDMTPDMLVEQEETFGPVVAISRYADVREAVQRANASTYGLGAVVFGGPEAEAVADELEAGMIGINQGVGGGGDAPWVGAKQSGFGFHGSPDGHRQFAQLRVVSRSAG